MLKVRYNIESGLLTGWTNVRAEFDSLVARVSEVTTTLALAKPDADDYEYFAFIDRELVPSGKQQPEPPRDLATEIDEIKARLDKAGIKE